MSTQLDRTTDDEAYRRGVRSTASFAGHPLHPVVVAFPVSFLMGALVTDLVYWFNGGAFWAEASFWLLVAGAVTGIVAALLGAIDFFTIDRARANVAGWIHAGVNVAAVILAGVNIWLRLDAYGESILWAGLILSLLTAALLGAGGWFGGELTFRYKIGVME